MRLRGPGRVAVQGNCVGQYAYAGGWRDASLGGVFGAGVLRFDLNVSTRCDVLCLVATKP